MLSTNAKMKRLVVLIAFIFSGAIAQGQSDIIKISPGSFTLGFFDVCYEHVVGDYGSFQISSSLFYDYEDLEESAFGITTGYKVYLTKKEAPRGFYLMPSGGMVFGGVASSFTFGLDLGYQWVWNNGICVDFSFGPKYFNGLNDNPSEYFDGLAPNAVFGFGYAF